MQKLIQRPSFLFLFAFAPLVIPLGCSGEDGGFRAGAGSDPGAIRNDATGDVDDDGCTRTQGYWKNHAVGGNAKDLPWPIPEDTELCGRTWLDILRTPTKGDAWFILAHQWIAAELNVASGAAPSVEVGEALEGGEALLLQCEIAPADRAAAIEFSELLDAFNNGLTGVDHCDGDDGEDDDGEDDGDGSESDGGGEGEDGCEETDGGEGPPTLNSCDSGGPVP